MNEVYDVSERADQSKGKYIRVNNRWLLDTSMGAGTHLFGHCEFNKSIKKALDKGSLYIIPNKIADECDYLLQQITKFSKFAFCNTGSEATLRCIRIAREYTNRDKIVLFEGCWHGTHDWNLVLYSKGIPQAVKDMVVVLPMDDSAIQRISQGDIAIVMVEPVQSSLPINQQEFLSKLRNICTKSNTVLCFDEVISGFRMAMGGATEYYGIKPDLVSYGKIIGGGLPIGIVGGDDVMDVIKKGVRMGGTFSANPLSMSACRLMLNKLIEKQPHFNLHNVMAQLQIKTDLLQIIVLGGMARLIFTNKSIHTIKERNENELPIDKQKNIIQQIRANGIYINSNNAIMLSTKHTSRDVTKLKESLKEIKI
jgi:glutamate-1-semialdehyde 2,1-aminomutase